MKIHILATAGMMTTPLALELKRLGHQVSGSDQTKIYPPFSKMIEKSGIPLNSTPIDKSIDLSIVGSAYKNIPQSLREYQEIINLDLPFISATKYIANNLIKENSILVAGTYAKTTITAFLSWALSRLNKQPSYFFGGIISDDFPSLRLSDSSWSVVEGDESINGLDTMAKFLYYPVKYLLLTSAKWEHKDSYRTVEENFSAFKSLVEKIPPEGIIVYNQNDSDVANLIKFSKARNIPYNNYAFKTSLIGKHNYENICAGLTLCESLGFDIAKLLSIVSEFRGVKRRLETIYNQNKVMVIDDFGQSAIRVKTAISAVKESYPKSKIKVFYEPHASFLQYSSSIQGFGSAFSDCQEVIFSRLKYNKFDKFSRVTASDFQREIGDKFLYMPVKEEIINYYCKTLEPDNILIHFSSGGLEGAETLQAIVNHLRKVYN